MEGITIAGRPSGKSGQRRQRSAGELIGLHYTGARTIRNLQSL
jgi:hypothetical protein